MEAKFHGRGILVGLDVLIPTVGPLRGRYQGNHQLSPGQEAMSSTRYELTVEIGGWFLKEERDLVLSSIGEEVQVPVETLAVGVSTEEL